MPVDSLESYGFDFDSRKNLFKLKNHSQSTKMDKFWFGKNSRYTDDYELYVYMGNEGKAITQICFYDVIIFEAIKEWAEINTEDVVALKGRSAELVEFSKGDMRFRLSMQKVSVSSITVDNSIGMVIGTMDDSPIFYDHIATSKTTNIYYLYTLTAITPIKPSSKWLEKQQQKIRKKGIKQREIISII